MSPTYLILFVNIVAYLSRSQATTSAGDAERWSNAAFSYFASINCQDVGITAEKECHQLSRVTKSSMNVYLTEPTSEGRLLTALPDGSLIHDGSHDGVLVLDPYPNANFGHLVIVFYLDLHVERSQCEMLQGKILDNGGECLSPVLKTRCHNTLKSRSKKVNFSRRCELDFLPLVYLQSEAPHQSRQRLLCRDIPGFASCPDLRPKSETEEIVCNHLDTNTKRCSTTHKTINTKCRMLETCDRAVLISGGWNRQVGLPRYMKNLEQFYQMLRENGFKKDNIHVFYANGVSQINVPSDVVYPSTFKHVLRYHLQNICKMNQCVDSLVMYLNNPTRNDGTSLLWDANGNGLVEDNEQYTVKEIAEDLENCSAHQVSVIADQSYSGLLVDAFSKSHRHANVQVFASSLGTEYAWSSEFTKHWANFRHTHTCTGNVQEASKVAVRTSNPVSCDGSYGKIRRTIFGAPCDAFPPFSTNELNRRYYGCQNVPISVWANKGSN